VERQVAHDASPHRIVTISVGVAEITPGRDTGPADLIKSADTLLYEAKHAGRNCVVS
jgi:two-component system chemotaxis family response regulator WspR